jgi:hypothetical protein
MVVMCNECGRGYDDEFRWTICPHRHLDENPRPSAAESSSMSDENKDVKIGIPADAETAKAFDENGVKPGDIIETDAGDKIRIGADTPPDVFSKPHSKTPASCGRIVHVYSNRWTGPRPGLVTQAWGVSDTHQLVNVTVTPDGCNDSKWLSEMAKTGQGTSIGSVGLYDPLTPEERSALICGPGASAASNPPRYHCEWMPYQAGQAAKTEDVTKVLADKVTNLKAALAALLKCRPLNLAHTDPNTHQAVLELISKC